MRVAKWGVNSKFMAAFKEAIELDKEKLRLKGIVRTMENKLSRRVGEMMELEGKVNCLEFEVKELKNLAEELRMDIVKKETHLDHLWEKSDELFIFYEQGQGRGNQRIQIL